jgi:hypothetical protein
MNAAQVATLKAERRAALAEAIAVIDTKPKHILFDTLRAEFVAVLRVFDAEDALKQATAAAAVTSAPAAAAPAAKPKATAPAPAPATKKARHWLMSLLPT